MDAPVAPGPGPRIVRAQQLAPVFLVVVVAAIALAIINRELVRTARAHRDKIGQQVFARAQELAAAGHHEEALELYRTAHNQNPDNVAYRLGFIRALRNTGREREAERAVRVFLETRPAWGPANVEMARILRARGESEEAAWYYHRALYGQWPGEPELRALRFELADLLAASNAERELMAELLLLDTAEASEEEARHIARLMLAAGAWPRAEQMYRTLLRKNRSDPELLAGLARAQFGAGRYLESERTFKRAAAAGGEAELLGKEAETVEKVNSLDPTLRRLDATEKHRRAHELASRLLAAIQRCATDGHEELREFETTLASHPEKTRRFREAEADLDIAERLWNLRERVCPNEPEMAQEVLLVAQRAFS